ncbi:MAG: hypothetical protein HY054_03570 [Proteobacteria bacterium]|nr:hypothetical protein [Pseudomonadota bacterium]
MARTFLLSGLLALVACGQTGAPAPQAPAQSTSTTPATEPAASKPATDATTQSTAWDRDLLALLPEIDACIAKQPDAREVTYAERRGADVFVRLSSPQNNFDCTVRDADARISGRDDALTIDGET